MIISLFGLKKFTVRFKVSSEFLHIFINVICLGGAGIHLAYQLRTLILKEVTLTSLFDVVFCSFGFLKQYFIFVSRVFLLLLKADEVKL